MTDSYFKNKITFLNVILTFMIVVVHAKTPDRFGLPLDWSYPFIYCVSVFCKMATPLFFFISALLFYRRCSFNDLERKFVSRVHTLLIPYLLWNIFFVLLYFTLNHIPVIADKMNMGSVLNTPKQIIVAILDSYHTDLWFVKNLMIFTVCSPVFLMFLKNKKLTILLLGLSIFMVFYLEPSHKNIVKWIPVYIMGAMSGYYWDDVRIGKFLHGEKSTLFNISVSVLFVLFYIHALFDETFYLYRIVTPILIWFITDAFFKKYISKMNVKKWMSYMFFIYCTHHFVLNVLQKIVVLTCPPSQLVVNITFVLSPVITILILLKTAALISDYKVYKLMCGRR